jgi:hypothetical protein
MKFRLMKKNKKKEYTGRETLYDIWTGKPINENKKLAEANKMIKLMEKKGTAPWLKK